MLRSFGNSYNENGQQRAFRQTRILYYSSEIFELWFSSLLDYFFLRKWKKEPHILLGNSCKILQPQCLSVASLLAISISWRTRCFSERSAGGKLLQPLDRRPAMGSSCSREILGVCVSLGGMGGVSCVLYVLRCKMHSMKNKFLFK